MKRRTVNMTHRKLMSIIQVGYLGSSEPDLRSQIWFSKNYIRVRIVVFVEFGLNPGGKYRIAMTRSILERKFL